MNYETLIVDRKDGIATITFNRPAQLNAFTPTMFGELGQATAEIARERETRVVILTGAGRAFCAGGDLNSPVFQKETPDDMEEIAFSSWQGIINMRNMDKPVIASVNGVAVGGGMSLALACDFIIASEKASFSLPFARLGLHPEGGSIYFLPRLVGMSKALELIFTGKTIDASEAERIGIVNQVVPPEELEATVHNLALSLAKGPLAFRFFKGSMQQGMNMDLTSAIALEAKAQAICMSSEDFKEGLAALREKRPPVFKGK